MSPTPVDTLERGIQTLTLIFTALPDVQRSMDVQFMLRFVRRELTQEDAASIIRIRREADELEMVSIRETVDHHRKRGMSDLAARRLAAAEFGSLIAFAVDSLVREASHAE